MQDGLVFDLDNADYCPHATLLDYHSFLVTQAWAPLIGQEARDDEVFLPYDVCFFEFRLSSRTLIAMVAGEDGEVAAFTLFLQASKDMWLCLAQDVSVGTFDNLHGIVWQEIAAICITLDAEVTEQEVIRAPHKLNKKREKHGKPLIRDHHIVKLAKRHRTAGGSPSTGEGTKKRLHFRRGHWRHYPEHKTWIKWMLVGDPDLGFVSKEYEL